jgi:hypothetical protein
LGLSPSSSSSNFRHLLPVLFLQSLFSRERKKNPEESGDDDVKRDAEELKVDKAVDMSHPPFID